MEISVVNSNERKTKSKTTRIVTAIATIMVVRQTLTPAIGFTNIQTQTRQTIGMTDNQKLSISLVRSVVKPNIPRQKSYFEGNTTNRQIPRSKGPRGQTKVQQRVTQDNSNESAEAAVQNLNTKRHVVIPELHWTDRRPPHRVFHQSLRLFGSTHWRYLPIKTS